MTKQGFDHDPVPATDLQHSPATRRDGGDGRGQRVEVDETVPVQAYGNGSYRPRRPRTELPKDISNPSGLNLRRPYGTHFAANSASEFRERGYEGTPREIQTYVPDHVATLLTST